MIVALLGAPTRTNVQLAYAWRGLGVDARVLWPEEASSILDQGDVAVTRLDVLPTLDGIEPGLELVPELDRARGPRAEHARRAPRRTRQAADGRAALADAGLPAPPDGAPRGGRAAPGHPVPLRRQAALRELGPGRPPVPHARRTSTAHSPGSPGAAGGHGTAHCVQELVGPARRDARVVVAGTRVVAGAQRTAAPGEWRTNVTLGGSVVEAGVPPGAGQLGRGRSRGDRDRLRGRGSACRRRKAGSCSSSTARWTSTRGTRCPVPTRTRRSWRRSVSSGPACGTGREAAHSEHQKRRRRRWPRAFEARPPRPGTRSSITGHSVGDAPKTAVILEVLGDAGHERFRVRWEDGHESIFFPADDAVIHRPKPKPRKAKA